MYKLITVNELKEITELSVLKEKVERWIELSIPTLDKLLITQANLGKDYLHLGQSNIKWMSVPEFRSALSELLESKGFKVVHEHGNNMKVLWR